MQLNRTGQFVTDNIDPENVALFLLGSASTLVRASATGQTYCDLRREAGPLLPDRCDRTEPAGRALGHQRGRRRASPP